MTEQTLEAQPADNTLQTAQTTEAQPFQVPQEYAGKGWVEKIKSPDDLWKTLDNAQSLLGKRPAGIPSPDASAEEWEKFYTAAGRPESADKYALADTFDGMPEGLELSKFKERAAGLAHKLGLNQKQAETMWQEYLTMSAGDFKEAQEGWQKTQAEKDAEFDQITQKVFGDQYDAKAKAASEFISAHLPQELAGVMADVGDNPKALAAMIAISDAAQQAIADVKAKYGGEDKLTSGQGTGISEQEIRQKLVEAKANAAKAEPWSIERKGFEAEVEKWRGQLQKIHGR